VARAIVALLEGLWRNLGVHLLVHLRSQQVTQQALIRCIAGPLHSQFACPALCYDIGPEQH